MSLLKIREPDGTVRVITIMKGDKGDGVPDGGSKGQVLKKTEGGTEWADADMVSNSLVMENTSDLSTIVSCTLDKRGLYEVAVTIQGGEENLVRGLLSVSNLNATFRQCIYSGVECYLRYSNGDLEVGCTDSDRMAYLSEVRLLIPYD